MDLLIGGWQSNLIGLFQTGQPFDLSTGVNNPGNRPDLVGAIKYPKSISGKWFDTTAFSSANISVATVNQVGVYGGLGTFGRNQLYGPGYRTMNLGLQKNLHLTERIALELHGDAFNVLNTPQFTNPNGALDNGNYGEVTSVRQYSNRQIQLSSRLVLLTQIG